MTTHHFAPRLGFLIAHRAGNHLDRLRDAEQLGVRLIEADVRLHRGRLEVRHLKSLGPVLWDTWRLGNPFAKQLQLHELLDALGPDTELMLDLKGRSLKLSQLTLAALQCHHDGRAVTVCARKWRLLEPFTGMAGIRTVYSVGTARQLRRLQLQPHAQRLGGVSIHQRLLDAPTVASLRERAEIVMTWPVNTAEQAHRLLDIGVHGLITDHPHVLDRLVRMRAVPEVA